MILMFANDTKISRKITDVQDGFLLPYDYGTGPNLSRSSFYV